MTRFLCACALAALALVANGKDLTAGPHAPAQTSARTPQPPPVHVGHIGPYCLLYVGRAGQSSPYRYQYNSWRYPRYYGGTHARVMQRLGTSPADVGLRDQAW